MMKRSPHQMYPPHDDDDDDDCDGDDESMISHAPVQNDEQDQEIALPFEQDHDEEIAPSNVSTTR